MSKKFSFRPPRNHRIEPIRLPAKSPEQLLVGEQTAKLQARTVKKLTPAVGEIAVQQTAEFILPDNVVSIDPFIYADLADQLADEVAELQNSDSSHQQQS